MSDDHDGENGFDAAIPDSLLPYDSWIEDAYRDVMLRALDHVGREGLPDGHHFYVTFLTGWPGVEIPARLRAQYPHDITIVLQHQFWDLRVDRTARTVSVGLSFGGVGSTLVIPVAAITAFADPHIRLALRFTPPGPAPAQDEEPAALESAASSDASSDTASGEAPDETPGETTDGQAPASSQVVSLAAFRKKGPNPS
ncbi:ClpXP protease specificity-enhancing factor SspB [Nguyenibacter sp. L1]|uniref:SspB family protein n=1 Tax=Nguyenibacter sp. L1 TaxID=3049350 RepID=UPI002B49FB27|nr:ClpXP protease specificity-enhancing factor SspB [Nguyenibacter sp. L1]WRH89260.1 ClpXP protease specificity-enhancing factor SspB [Nguyenibacter sp. L1]